MLTEINKMAITRILIYLIRIILAISVILEVYWGFAIYAIFIVGLSSSDDRAISEGIRNALSNLGEFLLYAYPFIYFFSIGLSNIALEKGNKKTAILLSLSPLIDFIFLLIISLLGSMRI